MSIFCAQCTVRPNSTEMLKFVAGKILLKGHTRRSVAYTWHSPGPPPQSAPHPGKVPSSWKGFSKALLKVRWQRGMVSFSRLPGVGFLCSFICPCRSGHDIPINLQQDKCCSMFCKFLSLYEWTLGGQTPEIRLPVYFML